MDGSPVGFASLEGNDEIDMLYVHPAAAGQGVGTMLVDALEKLAAARGAAQADGRRQRHRAAISSSSAALSPQQRNTVLASATNGSPTPRWRRSSLPRRTTR